MKKYIFRIIAAVLLCMLVSFSSACTLDGIGNDSGSITEATDIKDNVLDSGSITEATDINDNVLKAWSGKFSEEKLKIAVGEYRNNYKPFDGNASSVFFETDFDISSYKVSRIARVDDSDPSLELDRYIDLAIESSRDGRRITIGADWWDRDLGSWVQSYPIWSYLVLVRDTEGGEHYYYFRIDHASKDYAEIPDGTNFSFALTFGTYGISSYDSQTGKLVKTTDATHPEDYVTEMFLSTRELAEVYHHLTELGIENYPDTYDPISDPNSDEHITSEPPRTLILTVKIGDRVKTVTCRDIAYGQGYNEAGEKFLDTCQRLQQIITATDEWKALPDYENYYE